MVVSPTISALGEEVLSRAHWPASQPRLLGELQASKRACLNNNKVDALEEALR